MKLEIPTGDFEGYIFDCDGTLVDSMPLHYKAWTASFKHHNSPWDWSEDEFYNNAGVADHQIVANLNQQYGSDLCAESIHDYKLSWYMERMESELKPVEVVAEQVRHCIDTGIPISIGTGSDITIVEPSLKCTGLWEYFDIDRIITPKQVENSKPEPDTFLLAAERMNIAADKCLVFEDGQSGLDAAAKAGMQSVFVDTRNK